jgi:hypothetical protein
MKEGSLVNVCMSRNDCFSPSIQKNSPIIRNCFLKYTPANTGDMYHFLTEDGIEFIVNPMSTDFIGIEATQ